MKSKEEYAASVHQKAALQIEKRRRTAHRAALGTAGVCCAFALLVMPQLLQHNFAVGAKGFSATLLSDTSTEWISSAPDTLRTETADSMGEVVFDGFSALKILLDNPNSDVKTQSAVRALDTVRWQAARCPVPEESYQLTRLAYDPAQDCLYADYASASVALQFTIYAGSHDCPEEWTALPVDTRFRAGNMKMYQPDDGSLAVGYAQCDTSAVLLRARSIADGATLGVHFSARLATVPLAELLAQSLGTP